MPILSILIFLPLIASLVIAFSPDQYKAYFKWFTLGVTGVELLLCIFLYFNFDKTTSDYQFLEQIDWITLPLGTLGVGSIDYLLGVDGISLPMVVLTGIVMFVGAISLLKSRKKKKVIFTLLVANGFGDRLFYCLRYVFVLSLFEFMLLPMYFLIGILGWTKKRVCFYQVFHLHIGRFNLYFDCYDWLVLSVVDPVETALQMGLINDVADITPQIITEVQNLLKELKIPSQQIVHTFDLRFMPDAGNFLPNAWLSTFSGTQILSISARALAFIFIDDWFRYKITSRSVHTWLPDAHVEAPTPVSVVLAGILLKLVVMVF